MGHKEWCPGCDSVTSSLNEAWDYGGDCPNCGLSGAAWHEVVMIRRARDDDALAMKVSELIIENANMKQELAAANAKLKKLSAMVKEVMVNEE